jgi:RNA polymerase sigma-70 factor (ECF subfamily)
MADFSDTGREDVEARRGPMSASVNAWFVREVLPLEPLLMHYLRRHWPNQSEIEDLRQDIYVRVYEAARVKIPQPAKPFVFSIARNLLVDRVRREHVVPIEAVADFDALGIAVETPSPDQSAIARDELRRLQTALDALPPRCREAVILGRIEGLNGREIARRMGIGTAAVSAHLAKGIYALAEILYGASHSEKKE